MKPHVAELPTFAWQLLSGSRAQHELRLTNLRERDTAPYLDGGRPLTILDLANGRLRPQYALLRAGHHRVYGIDLANRSPRSWTDIAYQFARQIYAWRVGGPRRIVDGDRLICGDVGILPFEDNTFDLVTSVAAFEHFLDVPSVVAELRRVLRPGGVAWVCVHLFTSPSGGHNLRLIEVPLRNVPEGVDPWDHLRRRRLPFYVPLNEWRKDQYLETFARHLEVLGHYCAIREGEHLLTAEIAAELAGYSCDELTCSTLVILARKPA